MLQWIATEGERLRFDGRLSFCRRGLPMWGIQRKSIRV